MNFSKFSLLAIFALLSTLAVCYAKDAEKAEKDVKAEAVTSESAAAGSGASTEGGASDFDIEQLLKLIDALKNQDFDEVDRALKETKKDGESAINPAADEKKSTEKTEDKKITSSESASDVDEKLEL